jgi:hypothetical protein
LSLYTPFQLCGRHKVLSLINISNLWSLGFSRYLEEQVRSHHTGQLRSSTNCPALYSCDQFQVAQLGRHKAWAGRGTHPGDPGSGEATATLLPAAGRSGDPLWWRGSLPQALLSRGGRGLDHRVMSVRALFLYPLTCLPLLGLPYWPRPLTGRDSEKTT